MKKIYFAKHNFITLLFSILCSSVIVALLSIPVSVIVDFILIKKNIDFNIYKIFGAIFIALLIVWQIFHNFVFIKEKTIYMGYYGFYKKVDISAISSLSILSSQCVRKIILQRKLSNPIIANCFALIVPMGKFVAFKDKFGQDVIIGVWNYKKFYDILFQNTNKYDNTNTAVDFNYESKCDVKFSCVLKMPFKEHLKTYFNHFILTIMMPIFFSAIFSCLLYCAFEIHYTFFAWLIFILISAGEYFKIIQVVVDGENRLIKLSIFSTSNYNTIYFNKIANLKYVESIDEIEKINKCEEKIVVQTPYSVNHINSVIAFKTDYNVQLMLSINKYEQVYELLKRFAEE